jgi:preprotein translocase subunit SecE
VNRETKRMLQRQGQLDKSGEPAAPVKSVPAQARSKADPARRGGIKKYFNDVKSELKKVKWPSRQDVVSYSSLVFVVLVLVIAFIFGLNLVFSKLVFFLFK